MNGVSFSLIRIQASNRSSLSANGARKRCCFTWKSTQTFGENGCFNCARPQGWHDYSNANTIDISRLDWRDARNQKLYARLSKFSLHILNCSLISAHVELPASLLTPPNPQGTSQNPSNTNNTSASVLAKDTRKKHHLNANTDPLFGELRDLNFSSVGKTLNKNARRLEEDYKVKNSSSEDADGKTIIKYMHLE